VLSRLETGPSKSVGSLERKGVLAGNEIQQTPTPGLTEGKGCSAKYSNSISINANRLADSDLNILVASLCCQKWTSHFGVCRRAKAQKLSRDISQTKLMQGSLRHLGVEALRRQGTTIFCDEFKYRVAVAQTLLSTCQFWTKL
jgi:hypothetical protein